MKYTNLIGVVLLSMVMACSDYESVPEGTPEPPVVEDTVKGRPDSPGKSGDTPGKVKPAQVEDVPSFKVVEVGPREYELTYVDVPHPGPRTTLVAGWGYTQLHVLAMSGSIEDVTLYEPGGVENKLESDGPNFFSVLIYPDHPSLLTLGNTGRASTSVFRLRLSEDADARIAVFPSNGECTLGGSIKDGKIELAEAGRLWRWKNPPEMHFCTRPDEVIS